MAPVTATADIDRPPEDVFGYITDPARFPEWQRNVTGGHLAADGPVGVGAKCLTTRRIGFAERSVTAEVTHVSPPRTWGVRGVDGPVRATVNVTVEPLDEGRRSRLTIEVDFQGHGIGKLLVPLGVRPQARAEMPANLRAAKEHLETGS
jgi:uncharacterized protein YndB with AHSA1/START domain